MMTHRSNRPHVFAARLAGGAAALLLVGGCASVVTDTANGEYHSIPSSTNRVSDPQLATSDPGDPGGIPPEEASMSQVWALADSEVGDAPSPNSAPGPGVGLADFSAAVASRCYPQLADAERTELDQLRAAYDSLTGAEAADPAHAYFVRATELCM